MSAGMGCLAALPVEPLPVVVLAQPTAIHTLVAVEESTATRFGSQVTVAWLRSDRSVPFAGSRALGAVRLTMRAPGFVGAVRCGETVRVVGRMEPLAGYANPRAWDPRPDALRAGIAGVLDVDGSGSLAVVDARWWRHGLVTTAHCTLARPFGHARRYLAARVRASLPAWEAGVVNAFALGDTSSLDPALSAVLRANGTAHIIAVSGSHLTLVVAVLAWFLVHAIGAAMPGVFRRCSRRMCLALVCVSASWSYAALTGAPPSAVRAAFMVSVVGVVRATAHAADVVEALGFAVCAMIALDPETVCDEGWLLSVAGVIGLLRAGELWQADVRATATRTLAGRVRAGVAGCAQASLAASMATAPVVTLAFGSLALTGPVANFFAAPYAGAIALPWSLFATGVAAISNGAVASATAAVTPWVLWPLRALASTSPADWAVWWPVSPGGWCAVCALPALLWMASWTAKKCVAIGCVGLVGLAGEGMARHDTARPLVEAWFLDVGHGDATLLRLAAGRTMLVDAGGVAGDGGRSGDLAVAPVLHGLGIGRIDVLVLSHAHPDHGNGLVSIVRAFDIGEFWWNGQGPLTPEITAAVAEMTRRRVPVRRFAARDPRMFAFGASTVRVLWPRGVGAPFESHLGQNDNSLVLEVSMGPTRLLLTGDIEFAAESALVARGAARHADIVKVPHHGSLTSSSPEWLAAVSPKLAIASARPWARWPLPHSEVRARYVAAGAPLWETWRGMVHVEFGPDGVAASQGGRSFHLARTVRACSEGT